MRNLFVAYEVRVVHYRQLRKVCVHGTKVVKTEEWPFQFEGQGPASAA